MIHAWLLVLGGIVSVALAAYLFMVWRGLSQDWRPEALKRGRCVQVEQDLRVDEPFRIIGRPDQVYRLADGLHVPVDAKNRDHHRVYETDKAELSLQAWLLRRHGMPTAGYGYIAATNRRTGERRALKVDLGDDAYCERMIRRYFDLIEGRVAPRASRGAKCRTCGHASYC